MQSEQRNSVPVTVITGFLGSGKTTVLNRLLRAPDLADTAVIVNEFGEISLDHLLIEQAIENAVLLKNGCICCSVRGDLLDTIDELFRKRDAGELPGFSRIVIETTGLADPAPLVHTLGDTRQACHLDGIVTTVDAVHGPMQLRTQYEARHQVAFADRILLTKTDLAPPDGAERAIRSVNDRVPVRYVVDGEVTPDLVFELGPERRPADWLGHEHHHHDHADITSTVLRIDMPLAASALALWLDSLLSLHGAGVLRLKGIVRIVGAERPAIVQAVHHVLHRITELSDQAETAWGGRGGEFVVIHRGLPEAGLRASLDAVIAR